MGIDSKIDTPIRDEHILALDPPPGPEVAAGWRKRINAFPGRAVSDAALSDQQGARAGWLRLMAQGVSAGIARGLDAALAVSTDTDSLTVHAGYGLCVSGEDVAIDAPRTSNVLDLPLYVPLELHRRLFPPQTAAGAPDGWAAAPSLRLAIARAGANLLPRAAVLIAEPVTLERALRPDAGDINGHDPSGDPFDDLTLTDGARLALCLWPEADYGALPDAAAPDFRAALAYRIFAAEAAHGAGGAHPWETSGLPLGLLAFTQDWRVRFLDRNSVARLGGQPRPRTSAAPQSGSPFLWQARVTQFAEHLASLPEMTPEQRLATLALLPPVGLLPNSLLQLFNEAPEGAVTLRQKFFPKTISLTAVPAPLDQIDLIARDSAGLAPINLAEPDALELVLPLPGNLYDPALLTIAQVDGAFGEAVDAFTSTRMKALSARESVRRRRDALMRAMTGQTPSYPARDGEEVAGERASPLGMERFRTFTGAFSHGFQKAAPLSFAAGDQLFLWVRPDAAAGVSVTTNQLELGGSWGTGLPGSLPALPARQWTKLLIDAAKLVAKSAEATTLMAQAEALRAQGAKETQTGTAAAAAANGQIASAAVLIEQGNQLIAQAVPQLRQRGIAMVRQGQQQLAAGSAALAAANQTIARGAEQTRLAEEIQARANAISARSAALADMTFTQTDGKVDWGAVGKIDSKGQETLYFGNDLPRGADITFLPPAWTFESIDLATPESDFGAALFGERRESAAFQNFHAAVAANPFIKGEAASLDSGGIDGFIASVAAKLRVSNDRIDFGFALARTDMYRVRQFMLGNDAASRLATSAAIRDVARRDESARVTEENLRDFVLAAKDRVVPAATVTGPPVTNPEPVEIRNNPVLIDRSFFAVQPEELMVLRRPPAGVARVNLTAAPAFAVNKFGAAGLATAGVSAFAPDLEAPRRAATPFELSPAFAATETRDVQSQFAVGNVVERSVSVAERLEIPAAVRTLDYSLNNRETTFRSLSGLTQADTAPGVAIDDITVPGLSKTIAEVRALGGAAIFANPIGANDDRHESTYFSAAVKTIDDSVALMRLIEGRVRDYQTLLSQARAVRAEIAGNLSLADGRLATLETGLAEARHDIASATALFEEETRRVAALNARRAAILKDEVKVVLFRRPRLASRDTALAAAPASPALAGTPLAVCQREHKGAPAELRAMAEGFRNAPVAWFPAVWPLVNLFDRPGAMVFAIEHLRARAALGVQAAEIDFTQGARGHLAAVRRVMLARHAQFAEARADALSFDASFVDGEGLVACQRRYIGAALLGDLADSGHGRAAAARGAAAELETLSSLAACLNASFAEVPPVTRLAWAEAFSEFDARAPLRSLAVLPGWAALDVALRREQQGLADALYGRVNANITAAAAAVDDLVRVALLLAAHSPVDRLLAARVARPAPRRRGVILDLAVDPGEVRVGMSFAVQQAAGGVIASGVIEDFANGLARARIVNVAVEGADIGAGALAHLTEAVTYRPVTMPNMFAMRQ